MAKFPYIVNLNGTLYPAGAEVPVDTPAKSEVGEKISEDVAEDASENTTEDVAGTVVEQKRGGRKPKEA